MRVAIVVLSMLLPVSAMGQGVDVQSPAFRLDMGEQVKRAGDYDYLMRSLRPLADQGNPLAQYRVGQMFDYGLGVPEDPASAFRFYLSAARNGLPIAQHMTAVRYTTGHGVAPSPAEAMRWMKRAAGQGVPTSHFLLGGWYLRGINGPPDPLEAYFWFEVYLSNRSMFDRLWEGEIRGGRDEASRALSPTMIDSARKRVREWRPVRERSDEELGIDVEMPASRRR